LFNTSTLWCFFHSKKTQLKKFKVEVNMPKTVTVGKDWVLLSDLVPGSNENSIFKGQIQKGSIKIKESLTHPTDSTDSYVMRASDSGGNGDEVFKCGDGKL
ncbi:hypothetical protein EAY15_24005, partial [Vibrio anguillarum]|nr:hypothetical protein [Vibrio anguillarum]